MADPKENGTRRNPPNPPLRRCDAKAKGSGEQCLNAAIAGGNVCRFHGGSAPQVKAAADRRLIKAAEDIKNMLPAATRELQKLLESGKGEAVRLSAIQNVLDRAGLVAVKKNEVKVSAGEYTFTIDETQDFHPELPEASNGNGNGNGSHLP